MRKGDMRF